MSSFNPETHVANMDAKIVASLEKISEVFRVLLWTEAKEHRVSPIQLQLLIFLKYHKDPGQRRIAALAREFNLTKATISDSMRVLELKGLIERHNDTDDSRGYNFSLTPKGEEMTSAVENFPVRSTVLLPRLPKCKKLFTFFCDGFNLSPESKRNYFHTAYVL